jgi:hypothetical protein
LLFCWFTKKKEIICKNGMRNIWPSPPCSHWNPIFIMNKFFRCVSLSKGHTQNQIHLLFMFRQKRMHVWY